MTGRDILLKDFFLFLFSSISFLPNLRFNENWHRDVTLTGNTAKTLAKALLCSALLLMTSLLLLFFLLLTRAEIQYTSTPSKKRKMGISTFLVHLLLHLLLHGFRFLIGILTLQFICCGRSVGRSVGALDGIIVPFVRDGGDESERWAFKLDTPCGCSGAFLSPLYWNPLGQPFPFASSLLRSLVNLLPSSSATAPMRCDADATINWEKGGVMPFVLLKRKKERKRSLNSS